jgi:hypothetical protein
MLKMLKTTCFDHIGHHQVFYNTRTLCTRIFMLKDGLVYLKYKKCRGFCLVSLYVELKLYAIYIHTYSIIIVKKNIV